MLCTLQSVAMGSSENCLSDAASRPANSAAQGAPNVALKTQSGSPFIRRAAS